MSKKKIISKKAKAKEENKSRKKKIAGLKGGERIKVVEGEGIKAKKEEIEEKGAAKKIKKRKSRSKRYQEAKAKIDQNKLYSPKEAVALVKETSIAKFVANLEAHLLIDKIGELGELKLPFFKGKAQKVAVADSKTITQIKEGKIDFEVLLASPANMKELVPLAKVLGPKGLMPNPKDGTLVKDPVKAAENWKNKGIILKTEKKAPVVHLVLGKVDQKDEELLANIEEVIRAIGKERIKRATFNSTMGPGVKVILN